MLTLADYLAARRVSELQEIHAFWSSGERAPGTKPELVAALSRILTDEETVVQKLRVLSEAPMQLLLLVVRSEDFKADAQRLASGDGGISLEHYEIEAAARALSRRGFIEITRDRNWISYGREAYVAPREIGETIAQLLAEERRGPREVFSLLGHLETISPQRRRALLRRFGWSANGNGEGGGNGNGNGNGHAGPTPDAATAEKFLLEERGAPALLDSVENEKLRDLFRRLVREYGGVISRTRYEKEVGAPLKWDRKRWQRFVEGSGLGTMSTLSLDEFGIRFEGESIVLFREVVEGCLRAAAPDPESFDRTASARIDLLTDLSAFLRYLVRNPVRVTQGKTLYKSAHGRLLAGLVFKEEEIVGRDEILSLLWDLSVALGLVMVDDERIVKLTADGNAWESGELTDQVRRIYTAMLEERAPDGRDFHLRKLRRALGERIAGLATNRWRLLDEMPFVVRNEYLSRLEEAGIRDRYRNRFQYAYDPPKSSLPGLTREVREWILHRLFPLGLVELGMKGGVPVALRLTELGIRILGVHVSGDRADGRSPIVVNPDFEVLVFPEGDVLELVHTLDRFAERTKSEEVSHYRILKEGVERAVAKGMSANDILAFLELHSRTPIPQNVAYSIRDWGEKVRFAVQRPCVVLVLDDEATMDRVLTLDRVKALLVERLSPTIAALRDRIEDFRTLEELRALGVHLKN